MKKTNSGVRRDTFADKINKPVMLSHLTKSSGGAFFFNAYYGSRVVGVKKLDFQINDVEFLSISDVRKQSSGQFNVIGSVRWISEISTTPNGKKVRDAVIADVTGHIVISIWENWIDFIQEGNSYEILNVSIKNYFGIKLNTNTMTLVNKVDKDIDIDWNVVEMHDFKKQQQQIKEQTIPTFCCPEILSARIIIYPTCPTPSCTKKIELSGGLVQTCKFCGNSCLSKKLGAAFTGEINICYKDKD